MAYETTTVNVEKSQGAIRTLLAQFGAQRFAFGEEVDEAGGAWAALSFAHHGLAVRIKVPHKTPDSSAVAKKLSRTRSKTSADIRFELGEQEAKRIWRVMHWNLKARLEAVEEQVETFEEAFLAHIIDPGTGETIYEQLRDTGTVTLPSPLLALLDGAWA
jgi:hypothetical protein